MDKESSAVPENFEESGPKSQLLGNDLATLLASDVIPVVVVDSELCIRHISQRAETVFHVSPVNLGQHITEIQTEFDIGLEPLLTAVLRDVVNVDREIRDRQGCWYRLQIKPHKGLDGRVDGAVMVLVDIDAVKRCNRELADAVELTNSVIDTVPEPVLVLKDDLHVVIANRSFYATFKATPETTIDRHIYSMGDGQWDQPGFRILLDEVFPHRKDFLNHPIDFDIPGSGRKSFMACGRYIIQDQDAPRLLLLSLADITLLKKTENALIQAEKLTIANSLAASIAHEINNPLHAITNLLFLASTGEDAVASKAYMAQAIEEVAHVAEITRQTLNFYRQPTIPSLIHVAAVFDSLLALYMGRLLTENIAVKRQYKDAPPIRCLEGDLRQIFVNIVANAIDAMKSGGTLTIRLRASCDWRDRNIPGVRSTISDSGTGMDAAVMDKIYMAFFTTKSTSGTGLGMWVSARLVERMQAHLRVRSSTRPGRTGTTFSLFLPLDRRRRGAETPPATPPLPVPIT